MDMETSSRAKNSVLRIAIVFLLIIINLLWILTVFFWLESYFAVIHIVTLIAAFLLVVGICGKQENSAFKLPWIILILVSPVLGCTLYFFFGRKNATQKMAQRFAKLDGELLPLLQQEEAVMAALESQNQMVANQFRYLQRYAAFPVYRNTDLVFHPEATDAFEDLLQALSQAKEFIFMEYFIVQEAKSFARLKAVLADRVQHGVEVRFLYDDFGSGTYLDAKFTKRMKAIGVQCRVFNPMLPILDSFMNNRDHRKITVIDGKVGFTGGYNLADAYYNLVHPYGYWKDTGVKLTGDAVRSLTVMFLEIWNAVEKSDDSYEKYLPPLAYQAKEQGFVQPFADSPIDDEVVGENAYLNLIKSAKHTVYATTPYLIISDEMLRELCMAAQRGVDVRIVLPGISDHPFIHWLSRSYYPMLAKKGVRIFEYTPGYIHAKQILGDGETAIVGTVNLDFRSMYHHFEDGVLFYGYSAIAQVAEDFEKIFSVSQEVTEDYLTGRKANIGFFQRMFRLFTPLL